MGALHVLPATKYITPENRSAAWCFPFFHVHLAQKYKKNDLFYAVMAVNAVSSAAGCNAAVHGHYLDASLCNAHTSLPG